MIQYMIKKQTHCMYKIWTGYYVMKNDLIFWIYGCGYDNVN